MLKTVEADALGTHRGTICEATACLGIIKNSGKNDEEYANSENGALNQNNRPKMRIWGMLPDDTEEAGFGIFLDNDCYVLLLYYKDKLVALFDPCDYTLPELRQIVEKVIRVVRHNPLVTRSGRVLLSRN